MNRGRQGGVRREEKRKKSRFRRPFLSPSITSLSACGRGGKQKKERNKKRSRRHSCLFLAEKTGEENKGKSLPPTLTHPAIGKNGRGGRDKEKEGKKRAGRD